MEKSQEKSRKPFLQGLKVALVHDFLVCRGGAERVLEALAEMFPEAPIYTLLYDRERMDEAFADREIRTSFLQRFPGFLRRRHRWLLPFYPVAVEAFDLRDFDLVVSSSGAWSKGVVTRLNTKHVAYVHSPMRYVWDCNEQYLRELGGGRFSILKRAVLSYLRVWDREAADRPDWIVSNSKHTEARVAKYYRRESEVVYPPCAVSGIRVPSIDRKEPGAKDQESGNAERRFLTVSRLTPGKRVDVIVDAFNKLGLPLTVVGEGEEEGRLRAMAGKNVEIAGWKDEAALAELYANARAFVFAAEEDFGLAMAEAQGYGVPVVAYGGGGAREIVEEGVTGEFFAARTPEVLADGVRRFLENEGSYDRGLIRKKAERFSREKFRKEFLEFLEEKLERKI
jgi:glycosyltransferase involved in cell wall biosynthesis